MAKRSYKTPAIIKELDNISMMAFGRTSGESISQDICVSCGKPAAEFKDEISRVEYGISGLCQKCQDIFFAPPPEE